MTVIISVNMMLFVGEWRGNYRRRGAGREERGRILTGSGFAV